MASKNTSARFRLPLLMMPPPALLFVAINAIATPQTVADDACPKYAVDIAAFATCEGDRVVKPVSNEFPSPPRALVDDEGNPLPSSPAAIPRDRMAQTSLGHYLTALEAYQAKNWLGQSVLFVDVHDIASAAGDQTPQNVDARLPVMHRNEDGQLKPAAGFVVAIKLALSTRGLKDDAPIFAICRDGRQAAIAAELLAQAGVPHVFVVRGGIEGEQSDEGQSVGWRAARLALAAR